jgi:hypothetical protein
MNRLRWLELDLPFSLRTLGNKLKALTFTSDSVEGFLVDRVRDTYIEARYIQKIVLTDSVPDPLGNEHIYERTEYRQTCFRVMSDYPQMELTDSPRGIQAFTSRIAEVCDFGVSISALEVNVILWAERLTKIFPERFAVVGAQASGLVLEEGVTARVILTGTVDVRAALTQMTRGQNEGIDKVQLRFGSVDRAVKIVLGADGTSKILTETTEDLKTALRHSLAAVKEPFRHKR